MVSVKLNLLRTFRDGCADAEIYQVRSRRALIVYKKRGVACFRNCIRHADQANAPKTTMDA